VFVDARLDISSEVEVRERSVPEFFFISLGQGDAFAELPAWACRVGGLDHCDGAVILLDDDLNALLDLGQYGVEVARDFGFAHVEDGHWFHYGALGFRAGAWGVVGGS